MKEILRRIMRFAIVPLYSPSFTFIGLVENSETMARVWRSLSCYKIKAFFGSNINPSAYVDQPHQSKFESFYFGHHFSGATYLSSSTFTAPTNFRQEVCQKYTIGVFYRLCYTAVTLSFYLPALGLELLLPSPTVYLSRGIAFSSSRVHIQVLALVASLSRLVDWFF